MRNILLTLSLILLFPDRVEASLADWKAEITYVNFSSVQKKKIEDAVTIIRKVLASDAFRDRVLNHTVNGKKTFIDNQGFTNAEIYQKIVAGAEVMGDTSKNGTMNVELELFHSPSKTIGYTYPDTTRIWINTRYFERYTIKKVADNLMHEWMHKLGFDHARARTKDRSLSVPYAIGYLVEELAQEHL